MCTSFYYTSIDKYTGGWGCGSTMKDGLPDQEGLQ